MTEFQELTKLLGPGLAGFVLVIGVPLLRGLAKKLDQLNTDIISLKKDAAYISDALKGYDLRITELTKIAQDIAYLKNKTDAAFSRIDELRDDLRHVDLILRTESIKLAKLHALPEEAKA